MFDFYDKNTSEFRNFSIFVDPETNKIKKLSEISPQEFPYPFVENIEQSKIFTKEDFLSTDECEYLMWLADSSQKWIEETTPFWQGRNLPFFTNLQHHRWASNYTQQLSFGVYAKIKEFITKSFGEEVNADQVGIVRWPPGSYQMCYADEVDGLDRVAGCVVFLNDNYGGGQPFYPYYGRTIKPKTGMICAHDPGQSHLYGVTRITGETKYTISSTWTRNMNINPYEKDLEKMRNYLQSCNPPERSFNYSSQ